MRDEIILYCYCNNNNTSVKNYTIKKCLNVLFKVPTK